MDTRIDMGAPILEYQKPYLLLSEIMDEPVNVGITSFSVGVTSFLVLLTILVPFCSREFRNSTQLMLAYWFVLVLYQAVAFTNAFLFTTLRAQHDARSFHEWAVEIVKCRELKCDYEKMHGVLGLSKGFVFAIGDTFYTNVLGLIYWIFGPSLILGQQFSILAFSISCVVLIQLLNQLELSRYKIPILIAFGALPTMVFIGSLTMREPYMVMFFFLAVYFGLKMHITGGINRYLLFMIISVACMGVFHQALCFYALFFVTLFLLWSPRPVSRLQNIKKLRLSVFLVAPALILAIPYFADVGSPIMKFVTGDITSLLDRVMTYRDKTTMTRATYGIPFDFSSPFMAIYSTLKVYLYYLFAPFPWKVSSVLDVYASMESLLRLVLICFALKNWRNAYGTQRRLLGLMLVLYFSMTFLWAIGTNNYGTAMRHHMLSWWVLVIAGLPLLMETLKRSFLGFLIRRQ
jgi:hypothetical protein